MQNVRSAGNFRIGRTGGLGILARIVQMPQNRSDRGQTRPLFVVGPDHMPRRMVTVAFVEGFADRGRVGVPFVQAFDVDRRELPVLQPVGFARQEPAQLLGPPNVEPQLD